MDKPPVSVIIPAYNQAQYIPEAITNVLAQTYRPLEIIIVNDGSTDASASVLRHFAAQSEVKVVTTPNQGLAAARNNGIAQATGKLLFFLDCDDLFAPGKIERQVRFMQAHPEYDVSYTQTRYFRDNPAVASAIRTDRVVEGDVFSPLLRHHFITSNSIAVRAEVFTKVGRYEPSLRAHEDWDWLLRAAAAGIRFGCLNEALSLVRIHDRNMTRERERMISTYIVVVERIAALSLSSAHRQALRSSLAPMSLYVASELAFLRQLAYLPRWAHLVRQHGSWAAQWLCSLSQVTRPILFSAPLRTLLVRFKKNSYADHE